MVINCAAIPESLLEAELFGYVKGSFTGACSRASAASTRLMAGRSSSMRLAICPFRESKILRFLEQGEVQRIGGNDNLKVDVRVVAATNADLESRVKQNLFREDLYYRLAIFPINCPLCVNALAEIVQLAELFSRILSRA